MLRLSSVAAGVSLIAFSTLAFAGADNTTNEGSAFSPTASEGGLKSEPPISAAPSTGVATSSDGQPLALAAPTDVTFAGAAATLRRYRKTAEISLGDSAPALNFDGRGFRRTIMEPHADGGSGST